MPQGTRVELHLVWPAENALLSLYGSAGFCAPFHDPDEWCTHHEQQADAFVNLTLRYFVPELAISAIASDDDVDAIAQKLQALLGATTTTTRSMSPSRHTTPRARWADRRECQLRGDVGRRTVRLRPFGASPGRTGA
ncbi:MAG: hypothetical protein HZY76_06965 [Anaerolineae bacterium]|nr:MAG: hypothetical protein HZY76_06965 [Anaerolineae bacterium]